MKTILTLIALLSIPTIATAGATLHAEATANDQTHTLDIAVNDDGSYSLLIDGQAPAAPGAPDTPTLPTLP